MRQNITTLPVGIDADELGLLRFARRMDATLAQKRVEGRGGWHKPGERTIDEMRESLARQVERGNWVHAANYCMMIWNREHPEGA